MNINVRALAMPITSTAMVSARTCQTTQPEPQQDLIAMLDTIKIQLAQHVYHAAQTQHHQKVQHHLNHAIVKTVQHGHLVGHAHCLRMNKWHSA